jgi:cob(I)alamin adenosyltransferase
MSIATKTGDGGETSLFSGARVPKTHARIEAVGQIDELNAQIGMAISLAPNCSPELAEIQSELFDLGAFVANPNASGHMSIVSLEAKFEALEPQLPPLKNFILPGGHPQSSALHLARTVCRRAERACLNIELPEGCLPYLNRLSDYLFLLARNCNIVNQTDEVIWTKT